MARLLMVFQSPVSWQSQGPGVISQSHRHSRKGTKKKASFIHSKKKAKMYLFVAAVVQTSGALSWPLATCSNASFPTNLNKLKASVPITEEGYIFVLNSYIR